MRLQGRPSVFLIITKYKFCHNLNTIFTLNRLHKPDPGILKITVNYLVIHLTNLFRLKYFLSGFLRDISVY
jgi:hypothetical protein